MKKLSFYYGTMNSAKTANLLMRKHEFENNGFSVLLIKPAVDNRDGTTIVKSRIGLSSECKTIEKTDKISDINWYNYDVIMVDESQFLTKEQVKQLHTLSLQVDVYCFGLLSDFKQNLFEGSEQLMILADERIKLDRICGCGNPSNFNVRFDKNGKFIEDGDQIQIGGEDCYKDVCKHCLDKLKRFKTIQCLDKYF